MPNLQTQLVIFSLLLTYPCFGFAQTAAGAPGNLGSGSSAEQVRLSEILIITPQPYDPAQVAEARHKAEEAREAIRRGGAFADIARANSQGPSAAQGGDVGCFIRGNLSRSLEEVVFQMKVGDVSDVIRTRQGFGIFEVSDRGPHACTDLEVLNQPITPELKPYLEKLKQNVRKKWSKLIPKSAFSPEFRQGGVTIQFSVQRNGAITDEKVATTSGYSDLDQAALNAIREVSPFPPLPRTTKSDHLTMLFHFHYNPFKTTGP